MALDTKSGDKKQNIVNQKKLCVTSILAIILLIIPVALIYFDPILIAVQNNLGLENGSLVNELILRKFRATKVHVYLFNVSNVERFLAGEDEKMHLEEIGPFVYQEYRQNINLEINKEPGIMRYTPKLESVFVPEESIGDPKDINVTVPNIALLAAAALMSKQTFIMRQLFNMAAVTSRSRAFVTIPAYQHIWGYSDPLIKMANTAVPGLIYFKSIGVLERFYDFEVEYLLELGTTDADKFSVKKSSKRQANRSNDNAKVLVDGTFTYNDTYEGAMYPLGLTPETPIFIFRHGLCKTFQIQYSTTKTMPYGGDAFVYKLAFGDRKLCDSKGWCPDGLMNLADCYFGFPIALSKSHFLDADPQLLENVYGLKPNRTIHDTNIVVDPKISIGISGYMALQLNLVLADVGFNAQTRRLKDTVLPIANIIASSPPLIPEVQEVLDLVYGKRPYIIHSAQVICLLLGLVLLFYSFKMLYWTCAAKDTVVEDTKEKQTQ